MYIYIYIYIYVCVCVCARARVCVCVCVGMYILWFRGNNLLTEFYLSEIKYILAIHINTTVRTCRQRQHERHQA